VGSLLTDYWVAFDTRLATCAGAILIPLSLYLLASGLDDLLPDVLALLGRVLGRRDVPAPFQAEVRTYAGPQYGRLVEERPIAVLVPLWGEAEVIGDMMRHNLDAVDYSRCRFFLGVYPNDDPTVEVVRELTEHYGNVHLCLCPHDGPTSKADCLNWIYQHIVLYEEEHGCEFACFVTHDAEDVIHPGELSLFNRLSTRYDMVQTAVLPLPSPLSQVTHGVYCDEFAERHSKDLPIRQWLGGFIPSCGVGTGYSRQAFQLLAETGGNRVFDPECLTEDYENGLKLHRLGCRQVFISPVAGCGEPFATREYFPSTLGTAVRQRTRWITGIGLQSWERDGWSGGWRHRYWLWRDRKGLWGAPVGLLSMCLFFYSLASLAIAELAGTPWPFGAVASGATIKILSTATLVLMTVRCLTRAFFVGRIYGWLFALGVPVRFLWGTWIDCSATFGALARFTTAKLRGRRLVWLKTEHVYPSQETLRAALMGTSKADFDEIAIGAALAVDDSSD
jgi:bacteriophage N4 adsorption protein B